MNAHHSELYKIDLFIQF